MSSQLKSSEKELYKLNLYARHPIAQNRLSNLTPLHFEHLRDERLKQVASGTVHADFMLLRRVFKTALRKWGYGLPSNPIEQVQIPSPHKPRKRRDFWVMKRNAYSLLHLHTVISTSHP
tara:strand:- start:892 stop:1248 length:357 start_codon:yes stop_codon:yes gene_type:complete